jgi:phage-related protein
MDALDLIAKIKMDLSEYEEGLDTAKSKAEKSGSSISGAFGKVASGVGTAMATATKVTAVAIGAAVTGVATLTTKAVQSYAEYEQLVGGIETLFGTGGKSLAQYAQSVGKTTTEAEADYNKLTNAQEKMLNNASNAYKTAGLSANDYMNTSISMSAAMINSLGGDTEKAADMVDLAITDMSDNVNKMGTSMESIQNAYVGFSRGNYTMLDNLALGFSGTKEGMQELLDKAEELSGVKYDISSYADIVEAIHVVQTEMGITGTTALEASTTIQGALTQTKAAWENLLTGLGDSDADVEGLMDNLIESLVGVEEHIDHNGQKVEATGGLIGNVVPVVETALSSIATLIEKLVPEALDLIPTMITDVLPKVTSAATELVQGLVSSLSDNMDTISSVISQILTAFVDLLPDIISLGGQIISTLATAIVNNLDAILAAAGDILEKLTTGLSQNTEKLVNGAIEILTKLMGFLTDNADLLISAAVQIIEGLTTGIVNNLDVIIEAGIELAMAIFNGLLEALPELLGYIPDMISTVSEKLVDCAPDILEAATTMFLALVDALPDILVDLIDAVEGILMAVVNLMSGEGSSEFAEAALTMFLEIVAAVPEILGALLGAIGDLLVACVNAFNTYVSNMYEAGKELWGKIKDAVEDVGAEIVDKIKEKVEEWKTAISDKISEFKEIGKNLITGLWNGISDKASWLYDQISGMGSTVVDKVKSLFGVASPSKVFAEIGGFLAEGLGEGWDEGIDKVNKDINDDLKYEADIEVDKNYNAVTTTQANSLTDSDINRLAAALSITVNASTYLDGKEIGENTYNYMTGRITEEERARNLAMGGAY